MEPEDSNSSDSSGESADEGAVPRRDIQLDERGVAGYLLEVVNILGEDPHAFESLKELVDRHPQSLQRVGGPPHPPWPLRKGLAAAEGRVESRKPTPPCDRDASRHAPQGGARGSERNGGGMAGDNNGSPAKREYHAFKNNEETEAGADRPRVLDMAAFPRPVCYVQLRKRRVGGRFGGRRHSGADEMVETYRYGTRIPPHQKHPAQPPVDPFRIIAAIL